MIHACVIGGCIAALPFLFNLIWREAREAFRDTFGA